MISAACRHDRPPPAPSQSEERARDQIADAIVPNDVTEVQAGGPPTPAVPGMRLVASEKSRAALRACGGSALRVRLVKAKQVADEYVFENDCVGACTAAEVREGARQLRETNEAIERGELSDSASDRSFTECMFEGVNELERIETIDGREVALFADEYHGPHDWAMRRYRIAVEVCSALFISKPLLDRMGRSWDPSEVELRASPDHRAILVSAEDGQWGRDLYRLDLPACPGSPSESVEYAAPSAENKNDP